VKDTATHMLKNW